MALISVVIPVFNEEENLEPLYSRLTNVAAQAQGDSFEFVLVDDCSTDRTPEILRSLSQRDHKIKVIRFARNCGSHAALAAGLTYCKGDCAVTLAADLQDPPELILNLLNEWRRGSKIVWGTRSQRKGESFLTKGFSNLYYQMMNHLTAVKIPSSGTDVFLADRVVIDAFKQVTEKHTSVFMTLAWLGFKQASISYVKEARHAGRSKWTLGKKIKLTIDSLLSFSDIPIRWMALLGCVIALVGFVYAGMQIKNTIQGGNITSSEALIIAVLIIGGIQMIMLGIIGEYLWRTFDESRKRPRYIIEFKSENV